MPPGLTDTSFVRIDTVYLTANQLIQDGTTYNVKAVVFASGRFMKLPAFVAWVQHTFPHKVDADNGRIVYWR